MESADDIFLRAREITDVAARAAYLANACGHDHELRHRVEMMLRDADAAQEFFGRADKVAAKEATLSEGPGSVIGRYKLLEKIGEGGMGVVYMAQQREPVVRKVALKIIKAGMDTRQVIARFEAERQALALMDHPNIAKVLDGGATEAGRPYFVMDLVQGLPMTQFCDEGKLSMDERLKLFLDVCSAIQHAHQKGIIHRDIKPSNILVTLHGDTPVPKVIDFGIAKATQQPLTDKTLFTQFQNFIGTPAYMSPEQASLSGLDIDTRSDIYALGVLLYELLTGKTPFDGKELLKAGLDEMRRTIKEKEPPRPSTRLSTLQGDDVLVTARRRGTDAFKLVHQVRGDLDWIVMKCLEKDRARRYETANGLVADIKHHLNNEPVLACPPSAAYRFQKLVRRNKLQFATAMIIATALISAFVVSAWQAVRASRSEREQARQRALAENRLAATLEYVDRVCQDMAPQLWELIGAAKVSETLATNTMAMLERLRASEESSPEFRQTLGRLHVRLAFILGWPSGNSNWDPEAGHKAAKEAIRLLQPTASEKPSGERILQLARAEQAAAFTSGVLQAPEAETLAHYRELDRWAALITNSPSFGAQARMLKSMARSGPGSLLMRTGRAGEALTNYYLPKLRELETRGITEHSSDILDISLLSKSHKVVASLCLQLGRKEEALLHCREALRLKDVVTKRDPNNAEFVLDQMIIMAQLGGALLALHQSEGLQWVKEALDSSQAMAARDPRNAGAILCQINVRKYAVPGFIAWAADPSASVIERHERFAKAQSHLNEADKLTGTLRMESARKAVRLELEPARTELANARAKLE